MSGQQDTFVITQKELYYGIAALICAAFFIFVSGYFLGKKMVLEELAAQYDDECFADKVYQSFALFAGSEPGEQSEGEEVEQESDQPGEQATQALRDVEQSQEQKQEPERPAYAQLCGFGTKLAAELYVDRVRRRGISVAIVERKSRSSRGRVITWYQVVTQVMNRPELEELVQKMKKDDKLTSIQIIDVASEQSATSESKEGNHS
jgi:hypothetical protein